MQTQPIPAGYCQCGCGQETEPFRYTDKRTGTIKGKPRRFVHGHRRQTALQYKVDPKTGCWVWQSAKNRKGYGFFRVHRSPWGPGVKQEVWLAHRWFFSQEFGPIPEGMCLDHLCCNPACVRPHHLDLVTKGENNRRMKIRGRARGWEKRVCH